MNNDGKNYENFVAKLQQAIINSEPYSNQKNISVELNKVIIDNCNVHREFDIYWEYELAGITYKTVIECKDYKEKIKLEKIDALIGKTKDIPDIRPVFATKVGYQKGAIQKANFNKIDLLVVREQNETDWLNEDGNPLLKTMNIKLVAHLPAEITKFTPCVDGKWVKENTDIDITKPLEMSALNSEIIIEDLENDRKYSLRDLAGILRTEHRSKVGHFRSEEFFENAYIYYGNLKLKLVSYKIEYILGQSFEQPIFIDFSKELVGVIEYLNKSKKKIIFKNGKIQENKISSK